MRAMGDGSCSVMTIFAGKRCLRTFLGTCEDVVVHGMSSRMTRILQEFYKSAFFNEVLG